MKDKIAFLTMIGAIGSTIANLFGGWTTDIETLLIFMAIDFAAGLIVAGVFKKSKKSNKQAEINAGNK